MSEAKQVFGSDAGIDKALADCENDVQSAGGGSGQRSYFKIKEGTDGNKVRIMPGYGGQQTPWYHVRLHFNLMGPNGNKMAVLCGNVVFDECALCEESVAFREQGDNLKAWNASAKDYYLYNVIDEHGDFHILSADNKLQKELIKEFKFARSEDGGKYSPWDLKDGCFLKIIKTKGPKSDKQKFAPNVYAVHLLARKALTDDIIGLAKVSCEDLSAVYRVFKPEEIRGMLDGTFDPYKKQEEKKQVAAVKPVVQVEDDVPVAAPVTEHKPADKVEVEATPAPVSAKDSVEQPTDDLDDVLEEADGITNAIMSDDEDVGI